MAANEGRFIDRSPLICAAGKCSSNVRNCDRSSVADCMRYFNPTEDVVDGKREVWKLGKIKPEERFNILHWRDYGSDATVKQCVQPDFESSHPLTTENLRKTDDADC